ncbi:MAG TPA: TlpA disulfide reductase family protein [Alphaproteobacteria bacterium]|nr:TlpA disulfide reductase family protein [Alphaproteobacteria bacterium]
MFLFDTFRKNAGGRLFATALATMTGAAALSTAMMPEPAEAAGTKAINFQFTDINGKDIKLSDFKGKWVLVNFWAPWCPLCWVEVPTLNELNKRKDFVVIGVGLDYGPDENVVRDSASRHNLDFKHVVAGGARRNMDSPFRQVGPVDFYPTSYVYDPNGEIVMFIPGQVRMNKVLAFMEAYKTSSGKTEIAKDKSSDARGPKISGGKGGEIQPVTMVVGRDGYRLE